MTDNSRIAWLQARMGERDVDVLAAFSTACHTFQETNPVRVLTGYKNVGTAAAILDREGVQKLIVSPAWDRERAAEHVAAERVMASDDFAGAVVKALDGGAAASRQIGVAGLDTMPQRIAGQIREACGNRLRPMDDEMVRAGRCKTPEELATARHMAGVAEKVFDRLLDHAQPGMREFELAAELYRYSKALGADDNFLLMSASQVNQSLRPPGRRVMERGDVILGEISPGAGGQFVQICRSAVLGPISPVQQSNYDLLWRSMERGMRAATPGRTVAEVAGEMNEVIADAGYGDYCRPPFMRVRGHGLGNISNLPGDIGVDNRTVLEEGMLFVMHPNQYLPGSGYLLCGEPVVITPSGAEPLTRRYSRLTSIPV